ncbi:LINE-1 retrotransposable element ORF2 protein [Cucumis melo var. makuwa]|uniref:LINE-1 retrotransposable element ORF2 protein n=1 Tax=Cucumis melo var. makuwa TaxID=1194695 RepID=A0A5D3DWQ9_CUCMM|nr:LINE-1 retrotransposable element ORF2 protein [Cucumis melo var. makuwa]
MLADRLKLTLLETIVEIQLAFVKGRQITDAILMEHEIVDYWKLKKTKGFVLKLDIEKSFDTINWEFIDFMLMKKNYPEKWRNWIKASVMSVQYSVFINDKPCGRIKPNRVSNLQMAISLFEKASGLRINCKNSSLSPINVTWTGLRLSQPLGISLYIISPLTTLVSSLGENPEAKVFLDPIISKIHKKLNSWKYQHISKGGKLTLLKASLSSIPTYQLSVFKAPAYVYKEIEKHWRNFLWKSNKESTISHIINWNEATTLKTKGVLALPLFRTHILQCYTNG